MKKDYYKIFDLTDDDKKLSPDKFNKLLSKRFKEKAKQWHPDKFATKSEEDRHNAEEKFKEIAEAYDILSNKDKKAKYDMYGNVDSSDFSADFSNINDILRNFSHMSGFDFGFGEDIGRESVQSIGKTIKVQIDITLYDLYEGNEKEFIYKRKKTCKHCNGNGFGDDGHLENCDECNGTGKKIEKKMHGPMLMQTISMCHKCNGTGKIILNPCPKCNGTGLETFDENFKIKIPYGIGMNGYYINLQGMGDLPERNNGIPGNLEIYFSIKPNNNFKMSSEVYNDGNNFDLISEMEISVLDAITGCNTTIDTIDNKKIKIIIPQGTENGKLLRIQGKGLRKNNNNNFGDLFILIKLKFPKSVNKEEIKKIEELKKLKCFK